MGDEAEAPIAAMEVAGKLFPSLYNQYVQQQSSRGTDFFFPIPQLLFQLSIYARVYAIRFSLRFSMKSQVTQHNKRRLFAFRSLISLLFFRPGAPLFRPSVSLSLSLFSFSPILQPTCAFYILCALYQNGARLYMCVQNWYTWRIRLGHQMIAARRHQAPAERENKKK